ncbi:hypothetical protein R3P82_12690 [Dietzia maris]|uniref:Uncharacterized protein n=1 Tax=Dietzia maris TaxID=37915 RepID=A0AAE4U5K4_9ACTN|nr:hypothetical protein [Dietzia maris]MDV6299967.1 hypothetical protein [Dietzia maris]
MTDHQCRAGRRCRGRSRREDASGSLVWVPAETVERSSLCELCREQVARAAFEAEDLWTGLHALLGHLGSGRSGRRSPGPKSPVPINVHTDALMVELEDRLDRASEVVRERMAATAAPAGDRQARVARDARFVMANVAELVAVPRFDATRWADSGETWGECEMDGVDLALDLLDVVSRARSRVGITRRRDRMPVPCPQCEHDTLGRWVGGEVVDCLTCHAVWSEEEYRRLTMVLAEDYRGLV